MESEQNRSVNPQIRKLVRRRWIIRAAIVLVALIALTGAWFALGKPGLLWGTGLVVGGDEPPARFALPKPTGGYDIGVTELHLVDHDRLDPWAEGRPRELMVSVWYPATETTGNPLAPYMKPKAAAHFERSSLGTLGIEPDDVDIEGVRSHAFSEVPVEVEEKPYPVVLYSPGGGLPRTVGSVLVEELASRGYIVVTLDHTYEASEVEFPDGRLETAALPEDAGLEETISTRVSDARFVLDELETIRANNNPDADGKRLPRGLAGSLDLSKIGMFGHSAGGFTAAEAMSGDDRVDAGVNLDGSFTYSASEGEFGDVVKVGLDRPFMLMGAGTSGGEGLPHDHRNAPDWKSFWENSSGPKLDLHIPEGEHFTFADHQAILPQLDEKLGLLDWLFTGAIGTVNPESAIASQRAYVTAFFDQYLKDERRELLEGPAPDHPHVDFVR